MRTDPSCAGGAEVVAMIAETAAAAVGGGGSADKRIKTTSGALRLYGGADADFYTSPVVDAARLGSQLA